MSPTQIQIPYKPRTLQKVLARGVRSHRFSTAVCHRRFGKTVLAVNLLQQGALGCPLERPRFAYLAPTYRQGKAVAWDYMQHYAAPLREHGLNVNQAELRLDYPNGGQVRIYGADDPHSLRGLYFDGAVLDEFGLMPPTIFSEVVRATLADRQGWAFFIGTPAGKNQFYEIAQQARTQQAAGDAEWFYAEHKASDTGILPASELESAHKSMTDDEYAQEYECSFEAAIKGAIYAGELAAARAANRLTRVPYEPPLPVDTFWDLGVGDATAIWFLQSVPGGEIRVIDYYEASGEGLPFYATVLREKRYTYGRHYAPHDIQVREFASGRTRLEAAQSLGIDFQIVPTVPLEEGIHAARLFFPRCWFDAERCRAGLEALQHYRRDYNQRLQEYKATPVHDWASHAADAWRYVAVGYQAPQAKRRWEMPPLASPYVQSDAWMRR